MKKLLLFAGLAAAFAIVGCNKESEVRGLDRKAAEIHLTTVDTKTVNDGMSTLWELDDPLTVFYAPAGTTNYSANTQFKITDAESGLAKGDVELTADSYDWYLLYPYTEQITDPSTPVGEDGKRHGFLYFGCGSKKSQTQDGLDNMDHIDGIDLPMVGQAKKVSATETPEVTMKHLTSLVKINVTNVYENPVTITGISFTAPEDIIGTYYVDFSGDEIGIEPSGTNYVSSTAKLTVKDAAPLASGKTASFYIAIKPFTASSGSTLTVKVDTEEGSSEIETKLDKAHDFTAGKIKTLNVDFELQAPVETMTVSEALAADDDTMVSIEGAIVAARSTRGFIATDGKSNVYVYMGSAPDVTIGDEVTVTGTKTTYYNLPEIMDVASIEKTANGKTVPHTDLVELTADTIDSYNSTTADYISVTGKLEKSGNYYNVRLTGATRYASADYLDPSIDPSDLVGKTVTMTGYFNTIHSKNNYVKVVVTEFEEVGGADTETKISIPYNATVYVGETFELNATANVDATITYESEDPAIASVDANGVITGVAEGSVKVYARIAGVSGQYTSDEKYCNVTVSIKPQETEGSDVFIFSELGFENSAEVTTVEGKNVTLVFDKGEGTNQPKYYTNGTNVRMYKNNTLTVSSEKTITKIEFFCTDGYGIHNEATFSTGTCSNDVWEGSAKSVELVNATSGTTQIRFTSIKVTYE